MSDSSTTSLYEGQVFPVRVSMTNWILMKESPLNHHCEVQELPDEKHDRTSEIKSCRTNITELLELRVSIIKDMTRILKLKAAG
ncbi:hypothetical protein RhiirA5_422839 [Rhizophagus irregularis]|uniref:Uncharacterized protein n=1 Tax=Rhizophagus irregularis TaxID=588596 RepID=A0A2N0PB51_9GLOM|nr:hypothetical protein RhiirA5_422839 [Rhizophagus irregularis]